MHSTRARQQTPDLDRYEAEEDQADRECYCGLTPAERRELKRQLACGASGHLPLAATWRTLEPEANGRLHAHCSYGSDVSRSAFRAAA